jgi:dihydrofolate synthase/folylpolyglutamate synthase
VIQAIAGEIDEWYVAGITHVRGADGLMIQQLVNAELPEAVIQLFDGVENAYDQACIDANENDRIIILGSFFTVAEVMRTLLTATFKNRTINNGAR